MTHPVCTLRCLWKQRVRHARHICKWFSPSTKQEHCDMNEMRSMITSAAVTARSCCESEQTMNFKRAVAIGFLLRSFVVGILPKRFDHGEISDSIHCADNDHKVIQCHNDSCACWEIMLPLVHTPMHSLFCILLVKLHFVVLLNHHIPSCKHFFNCSNPQQTDSVSMWNHTSLMLTLHF